jgi:hypothetical protein
MKNQIKQVIAAIFFCAASSACSQTFPDVHKAVLEFDPRNANVDFSLKGSGDDLHVCVDGIDTDASAMDVFRVFAQTAAQFKEQAFAKVFLCFRGVDKFVLEGAEFRTIGKDYGTQNPIYTVRTFPEKLTSPAGEKAFPTREGGLLYLARVQMEDFAEMNKAWYLDALRAEAKSKHDAEKPKVFAEDRDAF